MYLEHVEAAFKPFAKAWTNFYRVNQRMEYEVRPARAPLAPLASLAPLICQPASVPACLPAGLPPC